MFSRTSNTGEITLQSNGFNEWFAAIFHILYFCVQQPFKVAPAVKKIVERVMSGTKGAAKAVQGVCNICGHDDVYSSMVNTDDEYYLQANTRSTRSRWDRHQLIPSSPFEKNLSLRDILKLEIVFLVTKYESMFYMPDYQSRDIPSFLLRTYIWARPVSDKRWQLRSPPAANCLRTALASTTTPLEQVQRKRSKKTEEMLVQGRHPSSKTTISKTVSSKTAPPVKLSIPMRRWFI